MTAEVNSDGNIETAAQPADAQDQPEDGAEPEDGEEEDQDADGDDEDEADGDEAGLLEDPEDGE